MKKRILIIIAVFLLINTQVYAIQQNREEAVSVALNDLMQANTAGDYEVVITYYANNKKISETITISVIDDSSAKVVLPAPRQEKQPNNNNEVNKEKKEKDEKKQEKEAVENVFTSYETGAMNLGFFGYENWFLWFISAILVLLIALPIIILRVQFVKTRRIVNYVITVFFEQ